MEKEDLFLLFSNFYGFQSYKILVKNLCDSKIDILSLFTRDVQKVNEISRDELYRVKSLKAQINKLNLKEIKENMKKKEINFLPYFDKRYPSRLKEISDPPFGLFYRGDLNLLDNSKFVGIVGTRSATSYGLNVSKTVASYLAEEDIVIVSGLAAGIDSSAHIGALKAGKTIAVLGTGPDVIFPSSNKGLYYEILEKKGLIVSEYPVETESAPWNFPQRNRIISALSDAVIVVEGDLQSGALITARFAIKQGKPLFAVPGQVDSPTSNGTNALIKSGVAELFTSVTDVLEKLGCGNQLKISFQDEPSVTSGLSENQKIIYKSLSSEAKSFDHLLVETKHGVKELAKELTILELKGVVEKTAQGSYVRTQLSIHD